MRFLPQKGNNTAIRGAKNPAKIGVFMVLAWILAIVGMISVVLSQLLGSSVN